MPEFANVGNNRLLYKKAYLIEFQGADGNPEDVFTFSIPPESEELTYSQRKTETKTFGGIHVDEYGTDTVKIVISGSTVNQELKMIYGGEKGNKWLSGEEEIYYLRDLILKHKSIESLKEKKKIMLYDLSKASYRGKEGSSTPIRNYWQAFPGDFKIRRSSDKPFTYKYSFEFTGVSQEYVDFASHGEPDFKSPPGNQETFTTPDPYPNYQKADDIGVDDKTQEPGKLGVLQSIMNKVNTVMEGMIYAIDKIDEINGKINDVLNVVNQVGKLLKVAGNVMSYATSTLLGAIDSVTDSIVGLIGGVTNIARGANSILSIPREIQLKALNLGLELQNATRELAEAVDDLSQTFRGMFTSEYWEIPQEVLNQYGMSNEEFKDSFLIMLNQAENTANEIAAAAKSSNIPEVTIGNPDKETGEKRIILSYGNTSVMVKETDTLESLASQYLGDPDRAIDIATYNSVASISDLSPGDTIKIPITTRTQRMKRNLIFARREDIDNYGRDILLSDDGKMVISGSGDYALTKGVDNLSQAILLRLRESVAKRIRLNAYGIRTNISDPNAGVAYIISSIELTVSSDPRVLSVDNIRFRAKGDVLYVNVDYRDINRANGNISGRA
jgi:hypothetical protein